jgi:transcriptional regulator ATRX
LERHFTNDELAQLYRFEPDIDNDPLDKYDADRVQDKILRHLLDEYKDLIVSYREHDSLLIHRVEENLTEEEQQQAQNEGMHTKLGSMFEIMCAIEFLDDIANKRIYGRTTSTLNSTNIH